MAAKAKTRARKARPKLHIKTGDTVFIRSGADREARLNPEDLERFDPRQQQVER